MKLRLRNLVAALAGIAALSSTNAFADTVTLWVNAPLAQGPTAPIYDELKAFEQKTGHKVELQAIPHQEFEKRLFVALGGGAGPDVMALDIAWVAGFADAGLLADLTDKTKPIAEQFQPGPLASGRYKERQYALPLYTNNVALFVNNDMLKEAGIVAAPKTWAEFKAAAKAMRALGPDKYGLSLGAGRFGVFQLYSFVWQAGGEWLDEKGVVGIGQPAAIEAVDFLSRIYTEDKAVPDTILTAQSWDEIHAPFIQGRAGMVITGDWGIAPIKKGAPKMDFSIVPLPVGKVGATVIGGFNIAVNAAAKSPAAAELAVWLTGPRSVELMKRYDRLSAQASATSPEALKSLTPEQRPFMEQAPVGRARPVVALWTEIHASVLAPAWDGVLRGRVTPKQAMEKAAEEIKAKLQ